MLYYLHGYLSNPNSAKGTLLRKQLNAIPIEYHRGAPESLNVDEALRHITQAIHNDAEPVLIGSSFGGFLAVEAALLCGAVKTIILLNPAIIPPRANRGTLAGIPNKILERMEDRRLFETKMNARIVILMATRDEVIPPEWVLSFAKAQQATVKFLDDDHAFSGKLSSLPSIIEEVLSSGI
jgi:predicted esterase YcpF (UPF0227 family)